MLSAKIRAVKLEYQLQERSGMPQEHGLTEHIHNTTGSRSSASLPVLLWNRSSYCSWRKYRWRQSRKKAMPGFG